MQHFALKPDPLNPASPQEVDAIPRAVSVRAIDLRPHARSTPHIHKSVGQLAWVMSGSLQITTPGKLWFVLPSQGLWIPPGVKHGAEAGSAPVKMRSVYAHTEIFDKLPDRVCIIAVDRLLQELINTTATMPRLYASHSSHERLVLTLMDQIMASPIYEGPLCSKRGMNKYVESKSGKMDLDQILPSSISADRAKNGTNEFSDYMSIPMPVDRRLIRVCSALLSNPADGRSLAEWSKLAGASERTLARLFKTETGMTFGNWLSHLRILQACQRLMAGESMSDTAFSLGYSSQSSFITMFKRVTGQTPARFYRMMAG